MASALSALWLPLLAVLFWLWLGRAGITGLRRDAAVFLLAVNPYTIVFGLSILSEVPYTALSLGVWRLLERERPALSALVAALAYLFRTAGIALFPAGVLWILWRRQRLRSAAIFSLILLPVIAAWMIWSRSNLAPAATSPPSTTPTTSASTS